MTQVKAFSADHAGTARLVQIEGDAWLVERLREPVRRALGERGRSYHVLVDGVGRVGEVVVRISGAKGRLPLLFDHAQLEAGYVHSVVKTVIDRYDF